MRPIWPGGCHGDRTSVRSIRGYGVDGAGQPHVKAGAVYVGYYPYCTICVREGLGR